MFTFDPMVNLGQVITIMAFMGSLVGAAYLVREQVKELKIRVLGIETEIKKMTDVLVQLGRQDERLTAMDRRIDDLQHGRGFVLDGLPRSVRAGS